MTRLRSLRGSRGRAASELARLTRDLERLEALGASPDLIHATRLCRANAATRALPRGRHRRRRI